MPAVDRKLPPASSAPNSKAVAIAAPESLRATSATSSPVHPMLFENVGVSRYAELVSTTPPARPANAPDSTIAAPPTNAASKRANCPRMRRQAA